MKISLIIIQNITYPNRLYFICPSTISNMEGGIASEKGSMAIKKADIYIHFFYLLYNIIYNIIFSIQKLSYNI